MIASVLLLWMLPLFKISVFLSIFLFQAERFVLVPSVSSKTIFTQFPMSLFTLSTIHRDCTTPQVHYGGCSHVVLENFYSLDYLNYATLTSAGAPRRSNCFVFLIPGGICRG